MQWVNLFNLIPGSPGRIVIMLVVIIIALCVLPKIIKNYLSAIKTVRLREKRFVSNFICGIQTVMTILFYPFCIFWVLKFTILYPYGYIVNMHTGDATIVSYSGTETMEIPSRILFWKVKNIAKGAFKDNQNITEVIIPDTITNISESAFENCVSLKEVEFPQTGINVEPYAFLGCTKLEKVACRSGETNEVESASIGERAFLGCTNLSYVELPKGTAEICAYTFKDCANLEKVSIPENVTKIGEGAFLNCSTLEKISFPEKLEIVDSFAFGNCKSIKEVDNISDTVQIGTGAFINTTWVSEQSEENEGYVVIGEKHYIYTGNESVVEVPEGVKTVDFYYNQNVEQIVLPDSLEKFSSYCLNSCSNLANINISSIHIPIENGAFGTCPNLMFYERQSGTEDNLFNFVENAPEIAPDSYALIGGPYESKYVKECFDDYIPLELE